jgi:shikimate kinase/3-dehydroquinate synthase
MSVEQAGLPRRIVLVGLSGSGKSAVGGALARLLGWQAVDSDWLIEAEQGRTVPQIFAEDGETRFRALERAMTARLAAMDRVVISTGGGAPLSAKNRRRLWEGAFVVALQARPETLLSRISAGSRPLVAGEDPLERLRTLGRERAGVYELADWTIATDGLSPSEIAAELLQAYQRFGRRLAARADRMDAHQPEPDKPADADVAATVTTPAGDYPIVVGWGTLESLGSRLRALGISGRVRVITDANVARLHSEAVLGALGRADYETRMLEIAPGEDNKTLAATGAVFDWLISERGERREAIVALGGGVVTDLAGFAAATFLRGVPLIHVPTSLLGAVDAAIGGKVAVDHRLGKNLIGAFYQPRLVLIDAVLLRTLPPRELISGWAEVIKHGLIADPELVEYMEENVESVRVLEPDTLLPVLRRSVEIKAAVVSADERESGVRSTLNYGHTIGHALEAAMSYRGPLHGEAVAVGMAGAGEIGRRLGLLSNAELERQNRLIAAYGLPVAWPGADMQAVLGAMAFDKKTVGATIRWVLLNGIGRTVGRSDVSPEMVREVVARLIGATSRDPRTSASGI